MGAEQLQQGHFGKSKRAHITWYSNNLYGLANIAHGCSGDWNRKMDKRLQQDPDQVHPGSSPRATKVALWGTNYLAPYLQREVWVG